jgi:hypothetical protein
MKRYIIHNTVLIILTLKSRFSYLLLECIIYEIYLDVANILHSQYKIIWR